jgi:hypothetical protein
VNIHRETPKHRASLGIGHHNPKLRLNNAALARIGDEFAVAGEPAGLAMEQRETLGRIRQVALSRLERRRVVGLAARFDNVRRLG